jgi:hypothetical protein
MRPVFAFAGVLVLALLWCLVPETLEVCGLLAFGWVDFLSRVLPQVTFDGPAIATGVTVVVLLLAGIHGLGVWFRPGGGWRLRWSLAFVAALVLMFSSGLAVVGLLRLIGWMFGADG